MAPWFLAYAILVHQNFLKVCVHVIIINKWNQTARLYEIQVTLIYSRASLVAVTSVCRVKRIISTQARTLVNSADQYQTLQNTVSDQGLHSSL